MTNLEKKAPPKEIFELLYLRAKTINNSFLDTILKATAAFLLVTGWLVTSQTASDHLQNDEVFKWLVVVGFTVYGLLFSMAAYLTALASRKVLKQLEGVDYIDTIYFSDLLISKKIAFIFGLANWILVGSVIVYAVRLSNQ